MTVKELKLAIANLPDNMPVILQKDSEGNGYSPCVGAAYDGDIYVPQSGCRGEVYSKEAQQDYEPADFANGVHCVVLWPNG